ncbi:glycosyltransferase family 4 protein [Patescibacteria group bacterium]
MSKSSKKSVLFYTDTPLIGGAENQMYLLAKFLDKEKYEVTLVCSDYGHLDEWVKKFENEDIKVMRLNVFHKHDPRHYFQFKEIIKRNHYDLIHLHVWNPAACRYALMAAGKYNIPTVVTEHDPFELPKLKTYFKQKLLKKISHVIAVSESNRKLMLNLFPQLKNRITSIHNGIDVTWFESQLLSFNENKRNEYREKTFNVAEDIKVILTVAELHERKGVNYLIKAMPFIVKKEENCHLVIAGSGGEREELETLVKKEGVMDHVTFLGFKKDIPHLMKASDVFVLPSIKEAFGLVILEAMAAELPIVASDVGGIPEIIKNGENGTLVPPHDEEKLAKAIVKLMADPNLIEKYVTTGFETLKKTFDAKMMAKNTEAIYDKVLT